MAVKISGFNVVLMFDVTVSSKPSLLAFLLLFLVCLLLINMPLLDAASHIL